MTNLEKLNNIFCEVFSVDESLLGSNFEKDNVDNWDSVHQLYLSNALEDEFDIMLDSGDILEFTSYDSVIKVLKKYDIQL